MILQKLIFPTIQLKIKEGKIIKGIIDKNNFSVVKMGELIKILDKEIGRLEAFETINKAFNLGKTHLTQQE